MEKNETKKLDKNYIIIAVIVVLVLLVIGFAFVKGCSKSDNSNNNEEVEKKGAAEEDIIKAYGMSKEDAIEIVKKIYNGDNFEFSADINNESQYVVSVKNIITENVTKFIVEPTTGSFYEE